MFTAIVKDATLFIIISFHLLRSTTAPRPAQENDESGPMLCYMFFTGAADCIR